MQVVTIQLFEVTDILVIAQNSERILLPLTIDLKSTMKIFSYQIFKFYFNRYLDLKSEFNSNRPQNKAKLI